MLAGGMDGMSSERASICLMGVWAGSHRYEACFTHERVEKTTAASSTSSLMGSHFFFPFFSLRSIRAFFAQLFHWLNIRRMLK